MNSHDLRHTWIFFLFSPVYDHQYGSILAQSLGLIIPRGQGVSGHVVHAKRIDREGLGKRHTGTRQGRSQTLLSQVSVPYESSDSWRRLHSCVYGAALIHGLRGRSHFSFGLLAEIQIHVGTKQKRKKRWRVNNIQATITNMPSLPYGPSTAYWATHFSLSHRS